MNGERKRTSLVPATPQEARLRDELRRLKIDPDVAGRLAGDQAQLEALSRLAAAATFLESNAEPLVMIDAASSTITYVNSQAMRKMPDLRSKGISHSLLSGWDAAVAELKKGKLPPLVTEVSFGMASYERRAFYDPGRDSAQFAFYEIKKQKDTTSSALMNPFPVIDYSIPLRFITFSNAAARKHFPGLSRDHRILQGLEGTAAKLRGGAERAVMDTIRVEDRIYRRGTIYVAQGDMLRIYASDITDVSSRWKAQLMELAAKVDPAVAPSNAQALAADVSSALALIKAEKIALGKLELDLNRLAMMLRSIDPGSLPAHEAESMRSVVAHFLETLFKA